MTVERTTMMMMVTVERAMMMMTMMIMMIILAMMIMFTTSRMISSVDFHDEYLYFAVVCFLCVMSCSAALV